MLRTNHCCQVVEEYARNETKRTYVRRNYNKNKISFPIGVVYELKIYWVY